MAQEAKLEWSDLVSGQNNVWYKYNESDAVIVFVHGFFAESATTWLYKDRTDASKDTFWPDLVHDDGHFGKPSQFLGGYYTKFDSGGYSFEHCADELFSAM